MLNGLEAKCIEFMVHCFAHRTEYKIPENVLKAMGLILKNISGNEEARKLIEVTFNLSVSLNQ